MIGMQVGANAGADLAVGRGSTVATHSTDVVEGGDTYTEQRIGNDSPSGDGCAHRRVKAVCSCPCHKGGHDRRVDSTICSCGVGLINEAQTDEQPAVMKPAV